MKLNKFIALTILSVSSLGQSHAAVTQIALWKLGESGSVSGSGFQIPLVDSIGTANNITNFQNNGTNGVTIVLPGSGGAPGSTSALSHTSTTTGSGWFGNSNAFSLTDNWALQIWVNPQETLAGNKVLMQSNNSANGLSVILNSSNNFAIAGGAGGVANITNSTVGANVGTWYQLQLIRHTGTNYLYINGSLAATGDSTNNSSQTSLIAPMFSFGQNGINGGLNATYDEMAAWNFASTDSLASVVAAIPEPSVAIFGGLSILGLLRRRRA